MKHFEFAWSALVAAMILAGAVLWTATATPTAGSATAWMVQKCRPVLPAYEFKIGRILPTGCDAAY
ncbi:MAG: hypothetical protein AB7H88_10450 [Vicinamibacterales bacterium]